MGMGQKENSFLSNRQMQIHTGRSLLKRMNIVMNTAFFLKTVTQKTHLLW